ncbi:hypothetical protein MCC10034_1696 [Bifidobacterium longum subsp. longum]|nr:hypothetical protein MCC10034_1696 [Bifidobacterium longum subsp. longum]
MISMCPHRQHGANTFKIYMAIFCRSRMILIRMNTLIITIFKMMQYWPL